MVSVKRHSSRSPDGSATKSRPTILNKILPKRGSRSMSAGDVSPLSEFDNSRVFRTYITYKEELEKFLSTHKHVPQNFEFWPHGPYWPYNESRHDENLQIVLRTPRHIRTIPPYYEPLAIHGNLIN